MSRLLQLTFVCTPCPCSVQGPRWTCGDCGQCPNDPGAVIFYHVQVQARSGQIAGGSGQFVRAEQSPVKLETKVAEDYVKFYNHEGGPYVKLGCQHNYHKPSLMS